jgi:hypothetical protein
MCEGLGNEVEKEVDNERPREIERTLATLYVLAERDVRRLAET